MGAKTTLEQDIQSFRNIIRCLRKFHSVGDNDPSEDFTDEFNPPYHLHYTVPVHCRTHLWNCTEPPASRQEIEDEEDYEDCNIFFHLAESKQPDENGNPKFQCMKFWGGTCDFMGPEYIWDAKLGIWSADSFGGEMYFEFLEPFEYEDNLSVPLRPDLREQTIQELAKGKRITQEGLNEWDAEYLPPGQIGMGSIQTRTPDMVPKSPYKILIYGSQGWIGSMMSDTLKARGHKVIVGTARVDDFHGLFKEVRKVSPDRVFSSTGRTHGKVGDRVYSTIDYLELPDKLAENVRDNLRGPLTLAQVCASKKIPLAYIGTGCIFQYDEEHPMPGLEFGSEGPSAFTEASKPNFFGSGYSTVKGHTDLLMRNLEDFVLNCRIRMPITGDRNSRNFITKITKYEKICSIPNSMTVLPQILPIIAHMMELGTTGTFNLTNPGYITHNCILDRYKETVDPTFEYKNFSLEEQAEILLSGRSNNTLSTQKLQKYCALHGLELDSIEVAVNKVLQSYEQSVSRSRKNIPIT